MIFNVIKRHLRVDPTHDWRRLIAGLCLFVLAVGTTACGSSSRSTPKQPTAVIEVENWLVDVGDTYVLTGEMSEDFNGDTDDLDYFWTALNEFEIVAWDDHCEDFPDEICDENFNDVCQELQKTDCTVNADCEVGVCKIGKQVCAEKQVTFCNNDDD